MTISVRCLMERMIDVRYLYFKNKGENSKMTVEQQLWNNAVPANTRVEQRSTQRRWCSLDLRQMMPQVNQQQLLQLFGLIWLGGSWSHDIEVNISHTCLGWESPEPRNRGGFLETMGWGPHDHEKNHFCSQVPRHGRYIFWGYLHSGTLT